jgi:hypothetical protein
MGGADHINELITWNHFGTDQMSALADGIPDEMWADEHIFIAEMRDQGLFSTQTPSTTLSARESSILEAFKSMNEAKKRGLDNDANQLPANKAAQEFWNTIKHKKVISIEDI